MSTPQLHLETLFNLDDRGHILSTREPGPGRGPLFSLIRGEAGCAWATHADLPRALADELDRLAQDEPKILNLREAPLHADQYRQLLCRHLAPKQTADPAPRLFAGPAFAFPDAIVCYPGLESSDIVRIEDERRLDRTFRGWIPGEIAAGRGPMLAIVADGVPVSVCFCARRSDVAAEAGLETAAAYRGRGYGPRVTAAWALAIQASGRVPLYSTSWRNEASLAVAGKLGLHMYASSWSLSG